MVATVLFFLRWGAGVHEEGTVTRDGEAAGPVEVLGGEPDALQPAGEGRSSVEGVKPDVAAALENVPDEPAAATGIGLASGNVRVELREAGTGRPAPGVGVELLKHAAFESGTASGARECGVTDAAGFALFEDVPAGGVTVTAYAEIAAEGRHYVDVSVEPGETTIVPFEVDGARCTSGYVVDLAGRRIGGAEIRNVEVGLAGQVVATSKSDGTFEVPYLQRKRLLSATYPGYAPSQPRVVGVRGGNDEVIVLTLSPKRGRVFGRVVDERGAGIDGAQLTLSYQPQKRSSRVQATFSGSDGVFEFADAVEGVQTLDARYSGGALTRKELTVTDGGHHEVVLRLLRGGTISGQVTGPDGAPYHRAMVMVQEPRRSPIGTSYVRTDEEGGYEFPGQTPGEGAYYVMSDEFQLVAEATLTVTNGQATEWNPVAIEPSMLHGYVSSSSGASLHGWKVSAQPMRGPDAYAAWMTKKTDDAAHFEVTPPAGLTYRIRVYAPGAQRSNFALERVDLDPNAAPFDLVVPANRVPSGVLTGRIVDEEGSPMAVKFALHIDGEHDSYLMGSSGEDGHFRINHVPPGAGVLRRRDAQGRNSPTIEVPAIAPGETRSVGDVRID